MPLREGAEDFVAWHFDEKGLFSVKQAYKLQTALLENEGGNGSAISGVSASLDDGGEEKWKRVWKMPCPGKIKHFLWRCAHNTLATKDILSRRGVKIENHNCFLCNARPQLGKHLFVECKEVKQVGRELQLEQARVGLESCSSIEQALDMLWQMPEGQRMQIITMWWLWWTQRNKVREGENPADAKILAFRAGCTSAEYPRCFSKQQNAKVKAPHKWQNPPTEVIKFNVDGALVPGQSHGAWGIVARDSTGEVVDRWLGGTNTTSP